LLAEEFRAILDNKSNGFSNGWTLYRKILINFKLKFFIYVSI
jgi:hypothetical protein